MWISGLQHCCGVDILYILETMKTDRYKTDYLDRSAQRSTVDGLSVSSPARHRSAHELLTPALAAPVQGAIAEVSHVQSNPAKPGALHQANPEHMSSKQPIDVSFRPVVQKEVQQELSQSWGTVEFPVPLYDAPKRPTLVIGKRKKVRRMVTRVLLVIFVLIFATAGMISWRGYATASKVLSGTKTVAALSSVKVAPTLLKGEGDGRVNILLLGVGGVGHDGSDLTDTMILASIDPVNNQVALLSIPRDLWVKMSVNYYGSNQKINAAYSAGKYQYLGKVDPRSTDPLAIQAGMTSVDTTVSQVLGIDIDYHVLLNFAAFAQAIDTVNGVTVDVKKPLIDASMAWENNNNATLVPAGQQQMNGKEALLYARSRHSSSDFDRSERQRELLLALKQKVLTLGTFSNPVKLDGLVSAFGKNVYSDLSTKAALRLYDIIREVDNTKVQSLDLVTAPHSFVKTDSVGTISVVRPILGFDTYSDIQTFVRSQLRDGYLARENAQLSVVATSQAQAGATQTILTNYGYNVKNTVVAATVDHTAIVDLTHGKAPYTRNYLEQRYLTKALSKLPAGIVVPEGTQFAILVSK